MPRTKSLLATFQQTSPGSRPAHCSFPPARRLLLAVTGRIVARAHGRWCSQKLRPWRGGYSSPGRNDLPSTETQQSTLRLRSRPKDSFLMILFFRLGRRGCERQIFLFLETSSSAPRATSACVIPWCSALAAWATHRYWRLAAWPTPVPRRWPLRSSPLTYSRRRTARG